MFSIYTQIVPATIYHGIEGLVGIILEPSFFLESIIESCIAIHFDLIPNSTQLFKKINYWICTLNTARP
jgi:hypothetical protein